MYINSFFFQYWSKKMYLLALNVPGLYIRRFSHQYLTSFTLLNESRCFFSHQNSLECSGEQLHHRQEYISKIYLVVLIFCPSILKQSSQS